MSNEYCAPIVCLHNARYRRVCVHFAQVRVSIVLLGIRWYSPCLCVLRISHPLHMESVTRGAIHCKQMKKEVNGWWVVRSSMGKHWLYWYCKREHFSNGNDWGLPGHHSPTGNGFNQASAKVWRSEFWVRQHSVWSMIIDHQYHHSLGF